MKCDLAPILSETLSAADVYGLIKRQDEKIFECEAKRKLLWEAWPG